MGKGEGDRLRIYYQKDSLIVPKCKVVKDRDV